MDRNEAIYNLFEKGESVDFIAELFNMNVAEVKDILRGKYFIASRRKRKPIDEVIEKAKTMTADELAEYFGMSKAWVHQTLRAYRIKAYRKSRKGERMNEKKLAIIDRLKRGDYENYSKLANEFGVSRQYIYLIRKDFTD